MFATPQKRETVKKDVCHEKRARTPTEKNDFFFCFILSSYSLGAHGQVGRALDFISHQGWMTSVGHVRSEGQTSYSTLPRSIQP